MSLHLKFGIFLSMEKSSHLKPLSLAFILCITALFTACTGDEDGNKSIMGMDVPKDYCELHDCLPLTARVHRPTVIKIDGVKADSNIQVNLAVLSCELLPGDSADSLFPACVDSVKFGKDYKLHQLRANDGRSQLFAYESIEIPVDSDNYLRFTFVDVNREEKSFDIDLDVYVKMPNRIGDSSRLSVPQGLIQFEGITIDTSFDKLDRYLFHGKRFPCSTHHAYCSLKLDKIVPCRE